MKKITREAVQAFINNDYFKKSNTEVTSIDHKTTMKLFGNTIAIKDNGLWITNCGYTTVTTKERLNGLLRECNMGGIFQRNFVWYYTDSTGHTMEMPSDELIKAR